MSNKRFCWILGSDKVAMSRIQYYLETRIDKDVVTGCWNWKGSRASGYGVIRVDNLLIGAHIFFYEKLVKELEEEEELDHLCLNKICVNPDHLEPVTHEENLRRSRENRKPKKFCIHGHPYTLENTYRIPKTGYKKCRICLKTSKQRCFERSRIKWEKKQ